MERSEEALGDLNRAVELDPSYAWAIAARGETYRLMKRYKEANADFKLARRTRRESQASRGLEPGPGEAVAAKLPAKRLGRRVYVVSAKLREFIGTEGEAA